LVRGATGLKVIEWDLKHGRVKVIPEVLDDLWVLYNVIGTGDRVYAKTQREVRLSERYDKPEKGRRITVYLGLKVNKVLWDRILNRLRVHGVIVDAPEKLEAKGSHHTIKVELNKPLTIVKDSWPQYQLDRLKKAEKAGVSPLIITSIDDEGYCIAVLRHFRLEVKAEEKVTLPGKGRAEWRAHAIRNLFRSAHQSLRAVWREDRNPIVILGLGFIKDDFIKYLKAEDEEVASHIIDVKGVNSTGVSAINEALRSGILKKALKDLRVAEEIEVVEEVLRRIGKGRSDVAYGLTDVERAALAGAVEKLVLTDERLREVEDEERRRLEDLMTNVERRKGRIVLVSTGHEAGLKLKSLGGVAALLRFPLS